MNVDAHSGHVSNHLSGLVPGCICPGSVLIAPDSSAIEGSSALPGQRIRARAIRTGDWRHALVNSADWLSEHLAARERGLRFFDFLAATDLGDGRTQVITHVMSPDASLQTFTSVELGAGEALATLSSIYRGAAWHEREAHDLLGVDFIDHPDLRPLLTSEHPPPLRRTAALNPRVSNVWPGLYEPGAVEGETRRRRRKPVPGVNDEWLSTDTIAEDGS